MLIHQSIATYNAHLLNENYWPFLLKINYWRKILTKILIMQIEVGWKHWRNFSDGNNGGGGDRVSFIKIHPKSVVTTTIVVMSCLSAYIIRL